MLAPFLGASPTTSASILVEFGGNDWAAGCVVAHVFSHMYISLAMRHTPHTRIHCAAMLCACEAPDPLARNTGVRSQGFQMELSPIPDMGSLPRPPLISIAQTGAGYECREIAQRRSSQCNAGLTCVRHALTAQRLQEPRRLELGQVNNRAPPKRGPCRQRNPNPSLVGGAS